MRGGSSSSSSSGGDERPSKLQVPHCPKRWPRCAHLFCLCHTKKQDPGKRSLNQDIVVYVLGGPGSGKGTQCSKIATRFGFTHLSVGELLQSQANTASLVGKTIQECKKEGTLVPSDITVKLLQQAMQSNDNSKFLVDGFPRNQENLMAAEKMLRVQPALVLVLECSEEEMIRRILRRNQGRVDDNIDTARKRLRVYHESTLPVIDYFTRKGKVRKIDAERPVEDVFNSIAAVFLELGLGRDGGSGIDMQMA